jgi:hypothetical protein
MCHIALASMKCSGLIFIGAKFVATPLSTMGRHVDSKLWFHTPQANLPKIHSGPIFPPTPWSSKWSLSFGLSHQNLVHFPLLSHACYMPRPPHSPWLDLPNDIWGWAQIMKLLTVQLPPFPRHVTSSLLGPNILLRILFSNTLSLCSSLSVTDQVSHPYKSTGRIMVLYILTFTFLDSRRDDKRLWTEW